MTRPDNSDLWDRRLDRAERHPLLALAFWAVGLTLVGLVVTAVVGLATTGSVFFRSASSNVTLKARENIQRNSTENAVTSIAFFHDQCNGVARQLAVWRVNAASADRLGREATSQPDPIRRQQASDEADQAAQDASGALNAAIAAAADYNAKAANSLTAKFRESGLPASIEIDPTNPPQSVDCG